MTNEISTAKEPDYGVDENGNASTNVPKPVEETKKIEVNKDSKNGFDWNKALDHENCSNVVSFDDVEKEYPSDKYSMKDKVRDTAYILKRKMKDGVQPAPVKEGTIEIDKQSPTGQTISDYFGSNIDKCTNVDNLADMEKEFGHSSMKDTLRNAAYALKCKMKDSVKSAPIKEEVEKVIRESDSLITALESVAAMYQIPSSHIIVDDTLNGIQVNGDMISAPDRPNPSANTKAIVCSIGAVLDHISQRIDDKLKNYQSNQCKTNMAIDNQKQPDPSKGEVVGRYFDRDGAEIVAYSSGLVDMDNTPSSHEKVKELRDTKQIPAIQTQPTAITDCGNNCAKSTAYFTDEDDIMKDVDTKPLQFKLNDIPNTIHESAVMIDLYTALNDSRTMGYDLLQAQGFSYVKPISSIITESDESSKDEVSDIKHMRFDNSHIMEAVRCFNDALTEAMPDVTEGSTVDAYKVMHTTKWKEGVRHIEDQFDCSLRVRYDADKNQRANAYTRIDYSEWRPKLKISKSKGFQLGGLDINITFAGNIMNTFVAKRDKTLFGQSVISVMLHEIHHNIVQMLRQYDDEFMATMSSAMMIASSLNSVKDRKKVISQYVNSITSFDGKKLGIIGKQRIIRELTAISTMQFTEKEVIELKKQIQNSDDQGNTEIEEWIKKLETIIDKQNAKLERNGSIKGKFMHGLFLTLAILTWWTGIGLLIFGSLAADFSMTPEKLEKWMKDYLSHPDKEEYYCDLFAGIYQLPVTWLFGKNFTKGQRANDINEENLKKLTELENELNKRAFSTYPSDQERAYAGYLIAQKLLENKDITKEAKEYAQWIVDNYSNLEKTGIRENYNQATFNPAEAEDLDAHIQRIIDHGRVTVTEAAKIM